MEAHEIKELRMRAKSIGIETQTDFAAKLGVRVLTVIRWEKNQASPSRLAMEKLKQLARKIEAQE